MENKNIEQEVEFDTAVIDTETLAMDDNAVVLTLSGVMFNRCQSDLLYLLSEAPEHSEGKGFRSFHLELNVTEQILAGRTIDPGTIAWWNKQEKAARDSILHARGMLFGDAACVLLEELQDAQVFFRGTDFDPPKIASLFRMIGKKSPWKYNAVRDVRTYIDALTGGTKGYIEDWKDPDWFVAHNSLHDCFRDAMQMQQARS
ncbi:3'-5' exoribonuclease domain-containing protein [Vibrio parahaemolyticus]|uniref:3'-5' exoribonuclease domain-containing protein n=1 Tax=Vibrio parahaemolyticus TaxID=670 RepID=UPI00223EF787|nr:3'-5' exoribonuclease [Vibrio parahaemolyticus]MDL1993005.1 3'-5' exoribonuclease [Vibrio parahaemolyticus]